MNTRRARAGLAAWNGMSGSRRGVATSRCEPQRFMASTIVRMTEKTSQAASVAPAPDDEDIAEAAARLSAKWASERPVNGNQRGAENGQIIQTLEKGRAHMVTVQVKRPRRGVR